MLQDNNGDDKTCITSELYRITIILYTFLFGPVFLFSLLLRLRWRSAMKKREHRRAGSAAAAGNKEEEQSKCTHTYKQIYSHQLLPLKEANLYVSPCVFGLKKSSQVIKLRIERMCKGNVRTEAASLLLQHYSTEYLKQVFFVCVK